MTDPFQPEATIEPVSALEPTSERVPTEAVELVSDSPAGPSPAAPNRARRLRLALAAVGASLVILIGAAGFTIVASAGSPSAVLAWAPADALEYVEIRADMPGDQRANLLALLAHFPGLADQTSFDAKADDGLNRLVKKMTDNKQDFSTEIKPWFSGQLGLSVESFDSDAPTGLLVASVRDPQAATTWLSSVSAAATTHESVGGVLVTEVAQSSGDRLAWAVDQSVVLAGSPASVKAAITRGPSNALASSAGFKAAQASLGGAALGTFYMDLKAAFSALLANEKKMLSQVGSGLGSGGTSQTLPVPSFDPSTLPGWVAFRIRAEADHLVLDSAVPTTKDFLKVAAGTSQLAELLPSDTVVQAEGRDLGGTIKALLARAEAQPGGLTAAQVDSIAKYVGGVDAAVGWLGDADLVVLDHKSVFSTGLVAQTTDATASANLLTELKSLASMAGSQAGLTIGSESYAGQTITTVSLAAPAGSNLPGDKLEIAFTHTDKIVIVGIGDDFVKSVLDTKPGASLADQAGYQKAIGLAGPTNVGQGYVDLTGLRTGLEALAASSHSSADYDANIKPYLEPISSLAWSFSVNDGISNGRWVLIVK
jgi:Protein of unknown function (DUF3352)